MFCKSCAARAVAFRPVAVRRSPCQRRQLLCAPRARVDPGEESYYRNHGHQVDVKGTVDRVEQEQRTIKNASLVTTLSEILPEHRDRLTTGLLWKLRMQTGFSYTEMFRKFLWFVLKERKFDETAVEDLIVLKDRMSLSNAEVAAALYERCVRIEKKFGNLMLQTEGLSERAVQRKATCRALFSKMLYLVENEKVLKPNDELNVRVMRNIFGATENDIEDLRIVSLHEVDLDKLDTMARGED